MRFDYEFFDNNNNKVTDYRIEFKKNFEPLVFLLEYKDGFYIPGFYSLEPNGKFYDLSLPEIKAKDIKEITNKHTNVYRELFTDRVSEFIENTPKNKHDQRLLDTLMDIIINMKAHDRYPEPVSTKKEKLDEIIEKILSSNIKIINRPITFSPEHGIFYVIDIRNDINFRYMLGYSIDTNISHLPVLCAGTTNTIPILREISQSSTALTRQISGISTLLGYMPEQVFNSIESTLGVSMLRLYSESNKNPKAIVPTLSKVFDDILRKYCYYVYMYPEIQYYVVVCWIFGTYLYPMFARYPFLIFEGEKGSGKGTNLSILIKICWSSPGKLISPSESSLFRMIEEQMPTLPLDEYHRLIRNPVYGSSIEALIEAGAETDTVVTRSDKDDQKRSIKYRVGCPKIISSRIQLEHEDKAVTIVLTKKPDQIYSKRLVELFNDFWWEETRVEIIKHALDKWKDIRSIYLELEPTDKLTGRYFPLWAPILAICKVIFPDKFDEMLEYAEAESSAKLSDIFETEMIVLNALYDHLDDLEVTEECYKALLTKEITEWAGLYPNWQSVKSALNNLRLLKLGKPPKRGRGVIVYLKKDRLHELFKERKIEVDDTDKNDLTKFQKSLIGDIKKITADGSEFHKKDIIVLLSMYDKKDVLDSIKRLVDRGFLNEFEDGFYERVGD